MISTIFGVELEIDPTPTPDSENYPRWIVHHYDDGDAAITCPGVGNRCGHTAIVNYDLWLNMPNKTTSKGRARGSIRPCTYCFIGSRIPPDGRKQDSPPLPADGE